MQAAWPYGDDLSLVSQNPAVYAAMMRDPFGLSRPDEADWLEWQEKTLAELSPEYARLKATSKEGMSFKEQSSISSKLRRIEEDMQPRFDDIARADKEFGPELLRRRINDRERIFSAFPNVFGADFAKVESALALVCGKNDEQHRKVLSGVAALKIRDIGKAKTVNQMLSYLRNVALQLLSVIQYVFHLELQNMETPPPLSISKSTPLTANCVSILAAILPVLTLPELTDIVLLSTYPVNDLSTCSIAKKMFSLWYAHQVPVLHQAMMRGHWRILLQVRRKEFICPPFVDSDDLWRMIGNLRQVTAWYDLSTFVSGDDVAWREMTGLLCLILRDDFVADDLMNYRDSILDVFMTSFFANYGTLAYVADLYTRNVKQDGVLFELDNGPFLDFVKSRIFLPVRKEEVGMCFEDEEASMKYLEMLKKKGSQYGPGIKARQASELKDLTARMKAIPVKRWEKEMDEKRRNCEWCGAPAKGKCAKCRETVYCDGKCQNAAWNVHKVECVAKSKSK